MVLNVSPIRPGSTVVLSSTCALLYVHVCVCVQCTCNRESVYVQQGESWSTHVHLYAIGLPSANQHSVRSVFAITFMLF